MLDESLQRVPAKTPKVHLGRYDGGPVGGPINAPQGEVTHNDGALRRGKRHGGTDILVRRADLIQKKKSLTFVGEMCFVSRPIEIVTFPKKNADHPKFVVDFLRGRDTFRTRSMEIVEDFEKLQDFASEAKFLHFP